MVHSERNFSEFVPSLERELASNFVVNGNVSTARHRNSPAPEFITRIIRALNVPDIVIASPKPNAKLKDNQQMEFFQALKGLRPVVSKRYAEWGNDAWVVLPSDFEIDPAVPRSKRDFLLDGKNGDFADQMIVDNRIEIDGMSLSIMRPLQLRPKSSEILNRLGVTDRSHSVHIWETYLQPRLRQSTPEKLVSAKSGRVGISYRSSFHSHGEQRQITRFSRVATAIHNKKRESVVVDFAFSDALGPTAVGCTNYHDMIEFSVEIPDSFLLRTWMQIQGQLRIPIFYDLFDKLLSESDLLINNLMSGGFETVFLATYNRLD